MKAKNMDTLTSEQTPAGAPENPGRRLFARGAVAFFGGAALAACGSGGNRGNPEDGDNGGDGGGNKPPEDKPLGDVPYSAEGYLSTTNPVITIEDILSAAGVDPSLGVQVRTFDATLVNAVLAQNANKYTLNVALANAKNPVEQSTTITLAVTGKNAQGQNVTGNIIVTVKIDTVPPVLVQKEMVLVDGTKQTLVKLSDKFQSTTGEKLTFDMAQADFAPNRPNAAAYKFDKETGTLSWTPGAPYLQFSVYAYDAAGNVTPATIAIDPTVDQGGDGNGNGSDTGGDDNHGCKPPGVYNPNTGECM